MPERTADFTPAPASTTDSLAGAPAQLALLEVLHAAALRGITHNGALIVACNPSLPPGAIAFVVAADVYEEVQSRLALAQGQQH